METKDCSHCKLSLPRESFPIVKGHRRKDGTQKERLNSYCKNCKSRLGKSWRARHPDHQAKASKEWRELNTKRVKTYAANYCKENRERRKVWKMEWQDRLPDKYIIYILRMRSTLTPEAVRQHPELIEAKRLTLQIKRLCKSQTSQS